MKVVILTDSAEMPDKANDSHDTHSWQLTSLQYTSHNSQHIFICNSHMTSFTHNQPEAGVCY
jgi:hypothetical protein